MKTITILATLVLTLMLAHSQALATCNSSCTVKLVDQDCNEVTDFWPADVPVTVAAACSEYCSYIDTMTNERKSYTKDYDAKRMAGTMVMLHGDAPFTDVMGDNGLVDGSFEVTGKKCGQLHLLRFDSTLDEGTKYWAKAYYNAVSFRATEPLSGCSVAPGTSNTAVLSAMIALALALVLVRRRRRGDRYSGASSSKTSPSLPTRARS